MRPGDPEVQRILDRSMIMRVASVTPKGQPIVRCLWFVRRRGRIYAFAAENTPTGRSIAANPEVAILFDGELDPSPTRLLRVRGRAGYRREMGLVVRAFLAIGRKYVFTRSGLGNLRAYARNLPLTARFYGEPGWEVRGQGVGFIMEVVPESFELVPTP